MTAPTCTEDGYTTHTCERCGDSYTDAVIAAPGHDYTCTKDGDTLTYTCTRCGDAYTEELIPTVAVNLQVGGSYTFTTANADITETRMLDRERLGARERRGLQPRNERFRGSVSAGLQWQPAHDEQLHLL